MSDFSGIMEALYAELERKRAENLIVHPVQYPDAHFLGLAPKILDLIFDELATLSPGRLWFKRTQLHISATFPPPLPLLLAHSKLHPEALCYFYEHTIIVLHIHAFDAAQRSPEHKFYEQLLREFPNVPRMGKLELSPVMNAGVDLLEPEIQEACIVVLEKAQGLQYMTIGWSEVSTHFLGGWRPWQ